jgi:hypothetical protein
VRAGALCREPVGTDVGIMVNERFARVYAPGRTMVGLHIARPDGPDGVRTQVPFRVAGVVADARETGLDREPPPTVYVCTSSPTPFTWFLIRSHESPLTVARSVQVALQRLEPQRSIYDVKPFDARIRDTYVEYRLRTALLLAFAGAALLLACLGIYGTVSYLVTLRWREAGLRLALGAGRASLVSGLIGRGARVAAIANAVGLLLTLALAGLLRGLLFDVSPTDPATLVSVLVVVMSVTLLAALVPALRVMSVDPVRALRNE